MADVHFPVSDGKRVWMGIDLGTSSVKVVLLDFLGSVVASDVKSTDADVASDLGLLGHEQNPGKIIETVLDMTLNILKGDSWHIQGNL